MPYKDAAKQKEYLRKYHQEYHQKRFSRRMEEMVSYLGGACRECSSTEHLEFDHIDPDTKDFAIKKKWTLPWEQLQKELDKCQLLCSTCHDRKTHLEAYSRTELQHGDWRRYRYHKCRCAKCKAGYNEKRKDWK